MRDVWQRIEKALASGGTKKPYLNKGCTSAALAAAEKKLGVTLPADFKECWSVHDGQDSGSEPLFDPNFGLLSLEEIVREWEVWRSLEESGEFKGRAKAWNAGWIPLTSNGGGDSHCLNLGKVRGMKVGQIILLQHEDDERPVEAESLRAWLMECAENLEAEADGVSGGGASGGQVPSMEEFVGMIGKSMREEPIKSRLKAFPLEKTKSQFRPEQYHTSKELGFSVTEAKKGFIKTVHLSVVAKEGRGKSYAGTLMHGLTRASSRADVKKALGAPTRSGEREKDGTVGWDRFDSATVCLHFSYGPGGKGIRLVTIMHPDEAP